VKGFFGTDFTDATGKTKTLTGKARRVFATDEDGQGRTDFSPQRHREHRDNIFSFGGRYRQSKTGSALRAERPGTIPYLAHSS